MIRMLIVGYAYGIRPERQLREDLAPEPTLAPPVEAVVDRRRPFSQHRRGETVLVAALSVYLDKTGLTQHRCYAACTLGRMAHYGLVARAKRGVRQINRHHPELMAIRRVGRPDRGD